MSSSDKKATDMAGKRLLDYLQNDLRSISNEAKKKMPQLKEASEAGIVRLRSASSRSTDLITALTSESVEVMQPFFMGCDSKMPKIVQTSLTAIQRLITFQAVSARAAEQLVTCLWSLMEAGVEELRVLQTITLLVSTSKLVQKEQLARALSLCFRLHFTKDAQTNNAASATIRQLCSVIFDRVVAENQTTLTAVSLDRLPATLATVGDAPLVEINLDELKSGTCTQPPRSLRPAAADAFMLFQDLLQLVNADQPHWLTGLTEMTRTFGLELLESLFFSYAELFFRHEEFAFLLKERVCPLVIKLLSPNIKYKQLQHQHVVTASSNSSNNSSTAAGNTGSLNSSNYNQLHSALGAGSSSPGSGGGLEKPFFPLTQRLLRIVGVLVSKFCQMLVTESEIFLCILLKLLEADKPLWQRCMALEVLHRMCTQPKLVRSFCLFYDMKSNSSKILRDLTNSLGIYAQSIFIAPAITQSLLSSIISAASAAASGNILSASVSGSSAANSMINTAGGGSGGGNAAGSISTSSSSSNLVGGSNIASAQPAFYFKGQWLPIAYNFQLRQAKCVYLEQLDKAEPPGIPEGYGLTIVFYSVLELVVSLLEIFDEDYEKLKLNRAMDRVKVNQETKAVPGSAVNLNDPRMTGNELEIIERTQLMPSLDEEIRALHRELLSSSWTGIYAVLSLLLDASTDELVTEQILNLLEKLIGLYGLYGLKLAQQAMISVLCRASLPTGYPLPQLAFKIPAATISDPSTISGLTNSASDSVLNNAPSTHSRSSSVDSNASGFLTQLSNNAYALQQTSGLGSISSGIGSNALTTSSTAGGTSGASQGSIGASIGSTPQLLPSDSFDIRQQVVAVGTALPHTASQLGSGSSGNNLLSSSASSSVLLTAKNLQCMKQLLKVAHAHGRILGDCWYAVLLTLQHLVWILGLKPTTGGSLKSVKQGSMDLNNANSAATSSSGGGGSTGTSGPIVTTAAMSDLPMLSTMLTRLFDSSQQLDDEGLCKMINALCRLSSESMEIAFNNREQASLFALAKLLETGLANLHRYHLYWNQITIHLLQASQHINIKVRDWGSESLTTLVKSAFKKVQNGPIMILPDSSSEQSIDGLIEQQIAQFLEPLQALSRVQLPDIRQRQLDACLHMLQTAGDTMQHGWPQLLDIIGSLGDAQNENLVRLAFQCLHLIVSDLLAQLPANCLALLIRTTTKFAAQTQELNVSLTAIGLLWNAADHLNQNQGRLKNELQESQLKHQQSTTVDKSSSASDQLPPFESLWMCLFGCLGDLCTDPRTAIRKSASQTLFHTLSIHTVILHDQIWTEILWKVLFPLLDRVQHLSITASSDKIQDVSKSMGISGVSGNSGQIMLHHSRNTAQKQWSETQVLTLAGVARVFTEKRAFIILPPLSSSSSSSTSLANFCPEAWIVLLRHVQQCASSRNSEVSLSALECLQEILRSCSTQLLSAKDQETSSQITERMWASIWDCCWNCWYEIGLLGNWCAQKSLPHGDKSTNDRPISSDKPSFNNPGLSRLLNEDSSSAPSQAFLLTLMKLFKQLYPNIRRSFVGSDFDKLSTVLGNALSVPLDTLSQSLLLSEIGSSNHDHINSGNSAFLNSGGNSGSKSLPLTPLQHEILSILTDFREDLLTRLCALYSNANNSKNTTTNNPAEALLIALFGQYLTFATYAWQPPTGGQHVKLGASSSSPSLLGHNRHSLLTCHAPLHSKYQLPNTPLDLDTLNMVCFAETSLNLATSLYVQTAEWPAVTTSPILHSFIKTLRIPLSLKYGCASQSTWKVAIRSLISILHAGLPVARQHAQEFVTIWADLAACFDSYLFPASKQPNCTPEELQSDEEQDVRLVEIMRDSILPHAGEMPKVFVLQVVSILNRGSIHSATSASPVDTESSKKLREEFAKACFETLLQFSFFGPKGNPNLFIQSSNGSSAPTSSASSTTSDLNFNAEIGLVNRLAVSSLLQRFHDVVCKYVNDEQLSGKCPLPRHRMSEISFVLKALATLISSLKKAPPETVEAGVWERLIALYPHLVDCTMSKSGQVNRSLREVLHEYKELLQPYRYTPEKSVNGK